MPRRLAPLVVALVVALVLVAAAAGCGGGASARAARCGPDVREPLDSHSLQHLIGDASVPPYVSDPPTSGAHRPGRWPTGVLATPIERPVQVAMLEGGAVLLQYRGLQAAELSRLEQLAGGQVTVAPNPVVADHGVIATAWTHKLTCVGVDVAALHRFVAAHEGKGA